MPLEEVTIAKRSVSVANRLEEERFCIQKIRELERRLNLNDNRKVSLHQVEKKFVLKKFDWKPNAIKWLSKCENECERNRLPDGPKKVEALRFFLIGSPKDWYETNMKKIELSNWPELKRSFLAVFVEKGWSTVQKAFNFKYLAGSLVDYALAIERLLLKVDPHGLELSRVNMIVFDLSIEVQEEIDMFSKKKKRENAFNKKCWFECVLCTRVVERKYQQHFASERR